MRTQLYDAWVIDPSSPSAAHAASPLGSRAVGTFLFGERNKEPTRK